MLLEGEGQTAIATHPHPALFTDPSLLISISGQARSDVPVQFKDDSKSKRELATGEVGAQGRFSLAMKGNGFFFFFFFENIGLESKEKRTMAWTIAIRGRRMDER